MTRINAGIDPKDLKRAHLVAEIREITMVPGSLKRSLRTKDPYEIKRRVPSQFSLNKGHVSFFYDKLAYLKDRFHRLADEMERRGYKPDRSRDIAFDGFPQAFYNNWNETEEAAQIVNERIQQRISEKPHLYKD